MNKPFSPSADRNKLPILNKLQLELSDGDNVLEIGSGTGQHACFFANAMPGILWQATELQQNIPAIETWLSEHKLKNTLEPRELDINRLPWPVIQANVCFTCNTLHIIGMDSVRSFFKGCAQVLNGNGKLCVYGPFSFDGQHTSASNKEFDQWLRDSNPASGVRDLHILDNLAQDLGFRACRYDAMPANNFFVTWEAGSKLSK